MMMGAALTVTAAATAIIRLLPSQQNMVWPAVVLLMVVAFGVFMGKAVILAPIAELQLPEEINGSAMAVGSFLVYASIFWANPLAGKLVEAHKADPYVGYQQIFWITLVVAIVGAVCAFILAFINKKIDKAEDQTADTKEMAQA